MNFSYALQLFTSQQTAAHLGMGRMRCQVSGKTT